jgi:hypothetical protein
VAIKNQTLNTIDLLGLKMVPSMIVPEKGVAAWPRIDDNSCCILKMTTDDINTIAA